MSIMINNRWLNPAEGSATFNGVSLNRIIYDTFTLVGTKVVWDKGLDATPISDANLFLVECGKCGNPQYGYAMVRVANAVNGQAIIPSCVCFSNVVNDYALRVAVSGSVCGHIKIDDDWYEVNEQFSTNTTDCDICDTEIVPINCTCFKVGLCKSSSTFDSDEIGFGESILTIYNDTTAWSTWNPWVCGCTYCV